MGYWVIYIFEVSTHRLISASRHASIHAAIQVGRDYQDRHGHDYRLEWMTTPEGNAD